MRLRRAERGIDSWTRSDAVLVRRGGQWRIADLATAILWEGPIYDGQVDPRLAGAWRTARGEPWRIETRDGLMRLSSGEGKWVPLFPIAPGRISAGFGSTLRVIEEGGRVAAVERWYGDRLAWRAARTDGGDAAR